MELPLSEGGIIATTVQGMLYGLSVLMYILMFWILFRNRKRRGLNYGIIGAAIALLLLATTEFAINVTRMVEGLITKGPFLPQGTESYFGDVTQPTFRVKIILYGVQTLILDGVVIYRAYVVWQSFWAVLLPVVVWLGLLATCIGGNLSLKKASMTSNVVDHTTHQWLIGMHSATLVTSLVVTGVLAFRVWVVHRQSKEYLASEHKAASLMFRIVIESGIIYSAAVLCALVIFLAGSPGVYVLLDLISPIMSIVFNMITVRVGFGADQRLSQMGGSSSERSNHPSTLRFNDRAVRRSQRAPGLETRSLAIELTQYVETDADADTSSIVDKPNHVFAASSSEDRNSKPFVGSMEP
ncbi:hypothetical protein EIP91_008523 [Steccherinum ochraceum]|uniref:Uncharacterized protein n=1 Tax=Steccherinum ochraceum TaxID=92696 RepID=A0A4R0R522_9APHY|nr:hypothetical protein EIP91_008523 [Steccherinum ochraceum]